MTIPDKFHSTTLKIYFLVDIYKKNILRTPSPTEKVSTRKFQATVYELLKNSRIRVLEKKLVESSTSSCVEFSGRGYSRVLVQLYFRCGRRVASS